MLRACIAMVRRTPLELYFLVEDPLSLASKSEAPEELWQFFKDMVADALQMLFMTINPFMV